MKAGDKQVATMPMSPLPLPLPLRGTSTYPAQGKERHAQPRASLWNAGRRHAWRYTLIFALGFISLAAAKCWAAPSDAAGFTSEEDQRLHQLQERLCADKELSCATVSALFADPRLTLYEPPPPAPDQPPAAHAPKLAQRNPYLTPRFGLLTPESLERCRTFIAAHAHSFDTAYERYGVPKEVICGHLRIETNFGIPTRLTPNPLGTRPAINQLVSLYVRKPAVRNSGSRFQHRQEFALAQLKDLLSSSEKFGWDLFEVPGSPTGAIGLVQFEPSNFDIAVDSNGDGKIDLFDGDDAILSVAHYLETRGFDRDAEHQKRAIYAYYGGHYNHDPNKFYMRAVLKYATEITAYLKDHPVEPAAAADSEPAPTTEN
jgi:membrane-bound lytic murein transglycosylase B